MIRVVVAVLLAALSVGVAGVAVAVGDETIDLADQVWRTRLDGSSTATVHAERYVNQITAWSATGSGRIGFGPDQLADWAIAVEPRDEPVSTTRVRRDRVGLWVRTDAVNGLPSEPWFRIPDHDRDAASWRAVNEHLAQLPLGVDDVLGFVADPPTSLRHGARHTDAAGAILPGFVWSSDTADAAGVDWRRALTGQLDVHVARFDGLLDEVVLVVRVNVDQDGRIRRIEHRLTGTVDTVTSYEQVVVFDLDDFGVAVDTSPPDGERVVTDAA